MITREQYFAHYAPSCPEHEANAAALLVRVNALLAEAALAGCTLHVNPATSSCVSGTTNGGYRSPESNASCSGAAPNSKHMSANAVDVYDPEGELDDWLTDEVLVKFGLYREHPGSTKGWLHLSNVAPGSGKRTFYP